MSRLPLSLLSLSALAFASVAHAYVPPSFFVVRTLARKHAALEDGGRFRHKLTVYKSNGDVLRTLNESVVWSGGDTMTVRVSDEMGNEIGAQTRKLGGTKLDEMIRPMPYDLLFLKDGASLFTHFRMLGLPLKTETDLYSEKEGNLPYKPENTVAFSRYEGRVAVVLSNSPPKTATDTSSTQLWVEKDSFLPLRAVFPTAPEAGLSSEPLEFKFSGYQVYKNFLYPRTMQVFRKGKLWVKADTVEAAPSAGPKPEQLKPGEPDGDMKDFLEMYFKWVR